MRLRIGARTDTGRVRELNEDVYAMRAEHGLFVVCDGMGGAPAGEVASQLAADAILEHINGAAHDRTAFVSADEQQFLLQSRRLAAAVRWSNEVVYHCARDDQSPGQAGMGTTVVGAWLTQHIASVAHVGDSRAYLWHDERLEPLTRDHSLFEVRIRAGLADRDETGQPEDQHVLVRVLGREPEVEVEVNEVAMQPGDYLLLCSDGLTRMVTEPVLAEAIGQLRQPQRICDHLIEVANSNGGADNITVVVVEVTGGWWRRFWSRWTGTAEGGARCRG
jgi:serine/threonine protein phosphatase PrpC